MNGYSLTLDTKDIKGDGFMDSERYSLGNTLLDAVFNIFFFFLPHCLPAMVIQLYRKKTFQSPIMSIIDRLSAEGHFVVLLHAPLPGVLSNTQRQAVGARR